VASADGVGTKLEVARQVGRYDTVGIDLVAMLVDDLACVGAEPLFLLDYVAVGALNPTRIEELVSGIAQGCRIAGAALLGGETAEHGGVMKSDDLDVAGFAVGVVERGEELGPVRVREGDVLIVLVRQDCDPTVTRWRERCSLTVKIHCGTDVPGRDTHAGEELLLPSVIYAPVVTSLRRELGGAVHAVAHVTGGGIVATWCAFFPTISTRCWI